MDGTWEGGWVSRVLGGRKEGRTGVAREFCYEAVGEGHYMFGG